MVPAPLGNIVAILNNKGGVGKTTVTANLAHALSCTGKTVLVMDLDSQCNLTKLYTNGVQYTKTLYDLLDNASTKASEVIIATKFQNLFCLPNVEETFLLEFDLTKNRPETFSILRDKAMVYAKQTFDYILIDCPPNMGFFIISAAIMADGVIIPSDSGSTSSLHGANRAIRMVLEDYKISGKPVRFAKVLLNKVDHRTVMSRTTAELAKTLIGPAGLFSSTIPLSEAFKQAEAALLPVQVYAKNSAASQAILSLSDEFLTLFT